MHAKHALLQGLRNVLIQESMQSVAASALVALDAGEHGRVTSLSMLVPQRESDDRRYNTGPAPAN